MSKLTRRHFLTGAPAVAVVAAVAVAVAPLAVAWARPKLATVPFGLWRPNLPETISHTLKAGYISLEEGVSPSQMNESAQAIEQILARWVAR